MGREKVTYPIVADGLKGRSLVVPPGWRPRLNGGTANHRLLDLCIAITLVLEGRWPKKSKPSADDIMRLGWEVAESQVKPAKGARTGLGSVLGSVEGWTPVPHDALHFGPTVGIALAAHRARETTFRDAWLRVIGGWWGLLSVGATRDGQIAMVGTRFWPFKGKPPVSEDGWVHLAPGNTLSQMWDAAYRILQGLPQRDNRGRERSVEWLTAQEAIIGHEAIIGLNSLLCDKVKIYKEHPLCVVDLDIERAIDDSEIHVKLLDESHGGGVVHSVAIETVLKVTSPGKHEVKYLPRSKK